MDAVLDDPTTRIEVDLRRLTVTAPSVQEAFAFDDFRRWCLLEGYDDIDLTLRHTEEIDVLRGGAAVLVADGLGSVARPAAAPASSAVSAVRAASASVRCADHVLGVGEPRRLHRQRREVPFEARAHLLDGRRGGEAAPGPHHRLQQRLVVRAGRRLVPEPDHILRGAAPHLLASGRARLRGRELQDGPPVELDELVDGVDVRARRRRRRAGCRSRTRRRARRPEPAPPPRARRARRSRRSSRARDRRGRGAVGPRVRAGPGRRSPAARRPPRSGSRRGSPRSRSAPLRSCRRCRPGTSSGSDGPPRTPGTRRARRRTRVMKECAIVPVTRRPNSRAASTLDVASEADERAPASRGAGSLHPVRPPEREVDELAPLRRDHVPGRLGRERRMERDLVQQDRLDQLRLGDRRGDLHDRLLRMDDAPLRHRPDLPREAHVAEILDRPLVEPDLAEVGEVLLLEDERLEEPEAVVEARRRRGSLAASACPARRG